MATRKIGSKGTISNRSFAVSSVKRNKTVFVDLDDKPARARVVREGFQVPPVRADVNRVDEFLSGLEILRPTQAPRVVAQGIAPGTKVGPGTVIDLVLAPRQDVPLRVFDDIHVAVRESTVAALLEKVQGDRILQSLALKYEDVDSIPDADRQTMTQRMASSAGMTIDDSDPDKNFTRGFNALRAVLAFK